MCGVCIICVCVCVESSVDGVCVVSTLTRRLYRSFTFPDSCVSGVHRLVFIFPGHRTIRLGPTLNEERQGLRNGRTSRWCLFWYSSGDPNPSRRGGSCDYLSTQTVPPDTPGPVRLSGLVFREIDGRSRYVRHWPDPCSLSRDL